MTENEISRHVVDAAYRIHSELGPGLLEATYVAVLCHEMQERGIAFTREQPIAIWYRGVKVDYAFRADLVVEDKVIVEVKSVDAISAIHRKQLQTYLKLADKRLGLLINFNVVLIKDGITRVANGVEDLKVKS